MVGQVAPSADVAASAPDRRRHERLAPRAGPRGRRAGRRTASIGRGAYVGTGVRLGHHCKVQNYALVYEPAVLEDGVFIGPAVVLTNDHYPRAVNPDGTLKPADDWHAGGRHGPRGCRRSVPARSAWRR